MFYHSRIKLILTFSVILLLCQSLFSDVRLPRLVSDGMVLQCDVPVKIWGWADPGENVTVSFNGKSNQTIADQNGNWSVALDKIPAGGPYEMAISGKNTLRLENILVGDVWICSGQSNMVLPMERVRPLYEDIIADAGNPNIRQFLVPDKYDFNTEHTDFESGEWQSANPENILKFTAAGYFFARKLYDKYKIPIGLINVALGGSPAEAWMSEGALAAFPEYLATLQKYKNDDFVNQIIESDRARRSAWYSEIRRKDAGYAGKLPWYDPAYDASGWKSMSIPGYWADGELGEVNGVVWFRREIEIPAGMTGKPGLLNLGRIVDADSVYINGTFVGTVSYQYPPRRYEIAGNILKPGKNLIVIRVINNSDRGGFVTDKPYHLTVGENTIDLTGKWQFQLGTTMEPLAPETFVRWKPAGLYNGMLAPLLNEKIKGIIWYQGESNTRAPHEYRQLFPAMIRNWRQKFDQGDIPFLFVQLANFMEPKADPSESNWAELRDAQRRALSVPNTAMAVAIDIGEWNDIHPLNKKDVGERLALGAQRLAYGEEGIVYSGPLYQSMNIDGNRIVLSFSNTGSGLMAKGDGNLKYFAIAGKDKKFLWANAEIKGDQVVVWNDAVRDPVAVRYGWADNPDGANLYIKEGLPASPFTTED